jgi:hypothetical protein
VDGWSGEAQLALIWEPNRHLTAYLHGAARGDDGPVDARAGLVEGYAELRWFPRSTDELRTRIGTFFLPTSFENIDPMWQSPYTTTLSALNTWIGEEVRPTGLMIDYRWQLSPQRGLDAGVSLFGGMDSSGALLAWRGWSMNDRLSLFDQTVPLPDLPSLRSDGVFEPQRDDGTKPFGVDLDSRLGWAAWVGTSSDLGASMQVTFLDSQGDRELYDGEYAWETELALIGADLPLGSYGVVAAEWMKGSTGMQPGPDPRVQVDFGAWYVLTSWQTGSWRWTLRRDEFETIDRDDFPETESNAQVGSAWTAAVGLEFRRWFGRVEWLSVDSRRETARLLGSPVSGQVGGERLSLELGIRW